MRHDTNERPLFCDFSAIGEEQRSIHERNTRDLFAEIDEVHELDDGYAFRIPTSTDAMLRAARFISLERLCCPFFELSLSAEPDHGAAWLELRGTPRVKEYIRDNVVQTMQTSDARIS